MDALLCVKKERNRPPFASRVQCDGRRQDKKGRNPEVGIGAFPAEVLGSEPREEGFLSPPRTFLLWTPLPMNYNRRPCEGPSLLRFSPVAECRVRCPKLCRWRLSAQRRSKEDFSLEERSATRRYR